MNIFLWILIGLLSITLIFGWGFMLWITAEILSRVFNVIGFFWSVVTNLFTMRWNTGRKKINEYFYDLGLAKDQQASVMLRDFFNKIMLKNLSIKFGNPDDTLSYYFAVNYLIHKESVLDCGLNNFGLFWAKFINLFERSKGGHLHVAITMKMLQEEEVLIKHGYQANLKIDDYKAMIVDQFESGKFD